MAESKQPLNENGLIEPSHVKFLYEEHAEKLKAFLISVLRDAELAGEALQATFNKTMEAGHTVRSASWKGWLFKVAFNEAMAIKRRQKMDQKAMQTAIWIKKTREETRPYDLVAGDDMKARVREAITTLPPEQQQVVRMRMYEDMTFAAISEALGVPLQTVYTRLKLALKKLEQRLKSKDLL